MKTVTRRTFAGGIALLPSLRLSAASAQAGVTPAEARAIAKEAYIYGFPLVDNYRVQYSYFVDRASPEFKAPWNQITNIPRVFTPADTAVQTPNSDTPYSWMGLDLRAEPIVLTLPPIEMERYFSVQFTDAYTFNFDYLGTRHHRQPGRKLCSRRTELERRDAQGREKGAPLRNGVDHRRVSHAVVQSGRRRQREEDSGRVQSCSRCRRFSAQPRRGCTGN